MSRTCLPLLLLLLSACATHPRARESAVPDMALIATLPAVTDHETPAMPQGLDANHQLPVGIGFTLSPTMVLFGGALDFKVEDKVTVGPALQVAFDDNEFLFAPFGQVKFYPLANEGEKLQPFLQGGAGLAFLDRDRRGDDWGFLLNFGGGLRYALDDGYTLGTGFLFNFVPGEIVNDDFYFSWELVQLVVTF